MSKNFEEEYRQMIDSEIPDLWDRIEAQLPKAAAAMPPVSEETEMSVSGTVKKEETVTARRRRLFHSRWMPTVIVEAAALIFVIAAFPVLFLPRGKADESGVMNGAAECADDGGDMDMGDDPNMYCEPADGYYSEEAEEYNGEAAAPMSEPQYPSGGFNDMTNEAESSAMEDAASYTADNASEENIQSVAGAETDSEEKPDLYQVEVQVLDRILEEQGGAFYEAVVSQDAGNGLEEGVRVYFRCARDGEMQNDCADVSFRRGEKYTLYLYGSGETLESYGVETDDRDLYEGEMYIVYGIILKKF